jgi:hypothetical protein
MLTNLNTTKWIKNTLLFLRPVILIYLGYVSTNLGIDGFEPLDLLPNAFVLGGMVLYLVNVLTDFLQKLDLQKEVEITKATLLINEVNNLPPVTEPVIE